MAFSNQGSSDQKQHLNLSTYAWTILTYDSFCFSKTADSQAVPLSTLLNRIFENFYETASASLAIYHAHLLEENKQVLDNFLISNASENLSNSETEDLFNRLAEYTASQQIQKISDEHSHSLKQKGSGKKFRLNNKNFDYLTNPSKTCHEEQYYSSIGQYLKAVFEEYAALPQIERERIYYRDSVSAIEDGIQKVKIVRITHNNGSCYDFKPYQIMSDPASSHLYLTGFSKPVNHTQNYDITRQLVPTIARPASMRISNIAEVKIMSSKSGKLTQQEKEKVLSILDTNGVQFMSDSPVEIRIRLTPYGIRTYNSRIRMRPPCIRIEEDNIYVFYCTTRQIAYYFLEYGRDAEVLDPPSLRDYFKKWFSFASDCYQD